jgi:hypothetical protein
MTYQHEHTYHKLQTSAEHDPRIPTTKNRAMWERYATIRMPAPERWQATINREQPQ